jgi:hypothetical protein
MLVDYDVFIIDTINIPYKYLCRHCLARWAVLEILSTQYIRTCNLGVPIMGPNYSHFAEATVSKTRGCISLHRTIEKEY